MSQPFYAEGGYIGKVTQQAVVKAGTGTPQIVIRFDVVSTADGEPVKAVYERTIYRAITTNTAEYVKEDLAKLGLPDGASIRLLDSSTKGFHNLVGTPIAVYCKWESDAEANVRDKWQLSRKFASKAIEGEAPDYDALDAMMGATVTKTTAKKSTNGAAVVAPAMSDDDLTAAVLLAITEAGGSLDRKKLGLQLLKAKARKADIDKATSDAFLGGSEWWTLADGVLTAAK